MKTITVDGKNYELNVNRAKDLGVLREVKPIILELTTDEAAVLRAVFSGIGGPPSGARGQVDNVARKLYAQAPNSTTDLDLTFVSGNSSMYFKK